MGLTVLLALAFTFTESRMTQTYDRNLVEEVRVENNHRIPADSIKYRIQTKPGDRFDLRIIDADIRRIYALDQFEDIRVNYEEGKTGRIIIFSVKEKKAVRSVKYEGLKSITSSEIIDKLKEKNASISPETPFDPRKIKKAESLIKSILSEKGHEDGRVTTTTEDVPTNSVVVTFKVDEGPKVRVQKITIQGNKVFSAGEIKSAMKLVKESNPINSILGKDTYFDLKLADDITRIRLLYAQHGYVRVNISDPVVETKPQELHKKFPPFPLGIPVPFSTKTLRRYFITIKIDEGNQYRIGQVNISGNKQFDEAKVRSTLGLVPGEIFNEVKIRENFLDLKKLYGARGYINFTAIPVQTFDEKKKLLNLSINIDEDRQFYVHRIAFSGNTTTRDRVIRREIMLDEGQLFNSTLWDQSIQRLNQLGYFEPLQPQDAEIKASSTEPEVDIRLKVKEKDRNLLGLTGGVSGIGGSFLGLNYQSSNFLGLGDTFGVTLQGGTRQSEYRLSFTEPYMFNRPLTAGFTAYATKFVYDQSQNLFGVTPLPSGLGLTDQLNFTQKTEGIDLFASYPVKIWQRAGLSFGINHSQTSAINPATADFFGAVKTQTDQDLVSSQTGTNFSNFHGHSLTPSFTINRTNGSVFNPTRGFSMSTTFEYTGGVLGGTVNYYRPSLDFRYFHPINKGRNTIAFRVLTSYVHGYGGVSVPYYQRLFLGGDFDVRGFDFREITPIAFITHNVTTTDSSGNSVTALTDDVVYVGGDTQAVMNLEYRIPIVGQIVTLAPFFDAGNAWVWDKAQLTRHILNTATGQFDTVPVQFLPGTNSGIRSSTGLELQIMLPVIRAPFRIIYAENPNRVHNTFVGPTTGMPFSIIQKAHDFKFTIGRTF
jgi:outer membrane protein insertion porin family